MIARNRIHCIQLSILSMVCFSVHNVSAQNNSIQVIDRVQVIDVAKGEVISGQRVVVRDTKIEIIGSVAETAIPEGAVRIDAQNRFLIPGLFDAHVHLISDADQFSPLLVAHGVTSVRDLGGPTEMVLELKRSAATRDEPTPDVTITGAIIDGKPPVWPFSEACETEEEANAAVRKLAMAGVDQIKVYSLLKREVYLAAVTEARRLGLPVTGHVPYSITIEEATQSGQTGIEHLEGFSPLFSRLSGDPPKNDDIAKPSMQEQFKGWSRWKEIDRKALQEILQKQKQQGVVHIPTLIVMASIGRMADPNDDPRKDPRMKYVTPAMENFWSNGRYESFSPRAREAVPAMTALVAELHRQGITLCIGTDLANPYVFAGSAVHDEMKFFADAGIPAKEILKMATLHSARLCKVDNERGTIETGKTASLVLLDENPLEDISAVRKIRSVWLRGQYFDRNALDRILNTAEQRANRKNVASDPTTPPKLPGEITRKGTYKLQFGNFDAGTESFVVSRAEDGFHVWSHSNPKGGGQSPSIIGMHYDPRGQLISGTYQTLSGKKRVASYLIEDNQLVGKTETSGGKPAESKHPLEKAYRISSPVYATEFMFYRELGLKPGESTTLQSVGFGFPDWKPNSVPIKVLRSDDESIEIDGKSTLCNVYQSEFESPMGSMEVKTWSDQDGHTVKSVMKFSFGTVTATRSLEEAK